MDTVKKPKHRGLGRVLLFSGLVLGTAGLLWRLSAPAAPGKNTAAGEGGAPAVQETLPKAEGLPRPAFPAEETGLSDGEKLRRIELSGDYPEELIRLARKNRETIGFVYDYPGLKDRHPAVDLSREAAGEQVPLLLQWDPRWGCLPYGDGILADSGCGPLCLSMAALRLTGDPSWTPERVAQLAVEHGWRVPGSGSSWTLISEGAELLGLRAAELNLSEKEMKEALEEGKVLILVVGPGDFTQGGHFLVVTGWQEGGFSVNDPNSRVNSRKLWPYERLRPQILNLWALEKQPGS